MPQHAPVELEAAVREALTTAGVGAADNLQRPALRNKVIVAATRQLFAAGKTAEAACVSSAGNLKAPGFAVLRANIFQRLGDREAVSRIIDLVPDDAALPARVSRQLYDLRVSQRLNITVKDHLQHWGPIAPSWADAIANIPYDANVRPSTERAIDQLLKIRADLNEDRDTFRTGFLWGAAVNQYKKFLARYRAQAAQAATDKAFVRDGRLLDLYNQSEAETIQHDLTNVQACVDAGRSIIITRAHVGMTTRVKSNLDSLEIAQVKIANGQVSVDNPRISGFVTQGDFQIDFLKTVKRIRKEQMLINILPDGAKGSDLMQFDLAGKKIQLGQGAATLAYYGRAATFFSGTKWENGRVRLFLRPGPVAEDGMSRAEFDQAFYAFYLECLSGYVFGAPEDIGGSGGIWPSVFS